MNNYETKQAAKKAYYAEKAKELQAEADQLYQYDRKQMDLIPLGQPILIGHHSERGHRAALKRSHNRLNKMCELQNKAEYYQRKASSMNHAISSDDEDAITKLKTKLAKLEARQERMKQINAGYRKQGGIDAIPGLTDEDKAHLKAEMQRCPWYDKPYPSFYLSNNNAEMRRLKQRIAELEKKAQEVPREAIKGNGYTITENQEDNRIWFKFDEKPSSEICRLMRLYGFNFSKSRGNVWVRMLNQAGRFKTQEVMKAIEPLLNAAEKCADTEA